MAWLDPTIHILFTFSDTLGEGIGLVSKPRSFAHDCCRTPGFQPFSPAKTIFTGIGVLLGVCFSPVTYRASHDIQLLGRERCRGEP